METWFIIIVSLCLCFLIRAFLSLLQSSTATSKITKPIPPGPPHIPIITSLTWLTKSTFQIEPILRTLHAKYGPMVTLRIGSRPAVFIADRSLAHQALIQNSSVFSDRPKPLPTGKIISSDQHNISAASYGTTWRVLRRNLAAEMLHPSRIKSFAATRKRVLHVLINSLRSDSKSTDSVIVINHLHHAMFSLLVFMCFGQCDDEKVKDIQRVQRNQLLRSGTFNILNFWPKITKVLFQKWWEQFLKLRKDQEEVLVPLIRARKEVKESGYLCKDNNAPDVVPYMDTLLDLKLPKEGQRNLDEGEIVSLCSEFLNAGTDTTATALQWIMANLVKYPHVQKRLVEEIRKVVVLENDSDNNDREVKDYELEKMPYLKAVVLEGLRRHPPGHFLLPHAVAEDVVLNGYLVPKKGTVNFMVAEIGRDPQVWEDPMGFKPERFLNEDGSGVEAFDFTGSKEIRMMPFGAGRRICPSYNLAMLHLEYFVANLVWNFDWKVPEGGDVDFAEKQEFAVVMKNPLRAHISPRI